MDDRLEVGAGAGIAEDDAAESCAIECARFGQHVAAEAIDDGAQARRTRRHGLARQAIGVDGRQSGLVEALRDVGLAGGDAAGQADARARRQASVSSDGRAGARRSSTNEFHSWQCGHRHSSSLLR